MFNVDKILNKLIASGGCVNFQNNKGNTPIIFAVIDQYVNIVEILMKNGANPSISNDNNKTAYDFNRGGYVGIINKQIESLIRETND